MREGITVAYFLIAAGIYIGLIVAMRESNNVFLRNAFRRPSYNGVGLFYWVSVFAIYIALSYLVDIVLEILGAEV